MRLFLPVLLLLALPLHAEEKVVAGLSQNQISITTDFDGSEIFIYGAVKRESPAPDSPLDVVVVVIGPSEPVIVRKKERKFGIWINDGGVQVDSAPSFYAISTSRPFDEAISHTENLRHRIGLDYAVRLIGNTDDVEYPEEYRLATIRLNRKSGLYFEEPGGVEVVDDTLFQTRIRLPAQLVEGDYLAKIYLARNRSIVDVHESTIAVRKVGLERFIFTMATEQSALYGIASILLALAAGWLASTFFRLFFP